MEFIIELHPQDLSSSNGAKLTLSGQGELGIVHRPATYPL